MEKIITQRSAQDDYHAKLVAQGMENAGADVFAITNDELGYVQVYCKHHKSVSTDKIDKEIEGVVEKKSRMLSALLTNSGGIMAAGPLYLVVALMPLLLFPVLFSQPHNKCRLL